MSNPRQCFYIDVASGWDPDHKAYIPSLVTEGEPGHTPLLGNGPGASPWYWSTNPDQAKAYNEAKQVAEQENLRTFGLTPEQADEIVLSSMAAGFVQ